TQHDLSSSIHLPVTTETIPTVIPIDIPTLRQYSRRARIAQSLTLPTATDEPASPLGDETSILTSGVQVVSVPPAAEVPTMSVPTGSGMVPTSSPILTTFSVVTPYSTQKGKEKMVESGTLKKKKLQEQIDVQLVPVEEVYVEALQVKHPIIDWEINTEGHRNYWKIIRLGGSTAVYQFFIDMLKHFDREDLNQLWTLMKETLSIRQATSDKEKELWVELKRLFIPD
nr:hypothetical protein [Tanacetum cinerariifolium]